jgi:CDP-diacylglycerol--serine O-phosphatidyltransferase
VPYQSFKDLERVKQRPFQALVASVLILVVILIQPQVTLFLMAVTYALSGPLGLLRLLRRKPVPEGEPAEAQKGELP